MLHISRGLRFKNYGIGSPYGKRGEVDPDANLNEQLELARGFIAQADTHPTLRSEFVSLDDAVRLAELVLALDAWLRQFGALPRTWRE